MPRNKRLELEYVSPNKWRTADSRFGIIKLRKPINPMQASVDFKIKYYYSIRDLRDFEMLEDGYYILANEIGRVDTYAEVFPWLGKYTGEGSFDTEDVNQITPRKASGINELRNLKDEVIV